MTMPAGGPPPGALEPWSLKGIDLSLECPTKLMVRQSGECKYPYCLFNLPAVPSIL